MMRSRFGTICIGMAFCVVSSSAFAQDTIRLIVEDASGSPAADVCFRLRSLGASYFAKTDQNGIATMTPGELGDSGSVVVAIEGGGGGDVPWTANESVHLVHAMYDRLQTSSVPQYIKVDLLPQTNLYEVTVELGVGLMIRGTLTDARGQPTNGLVSGGWFGTPCVAKADEGGSISIAGAPSGVDLTLFVTTDDNCCTTVPVEVPSGQVGVDGSIGAVIVPDVPAAAATPVVALLNTGQWIDAAVGTPIPGVSLIAEDASHIVSSFSMAFDALGRGTLHSGSLPLRAIKYYVAPGRWSSTPEQLALFRAVRDDVDLSTTSIIVIDAAQNGAVPIEVDLMAAHQAIWGALSVVD